LKIYEIYFCILKKKWENKVWCELNWWTRINAWIQSSRQWCTGSRIELINTCYCSSWLSCPKRKFYLYYANIEKWYVYMSDLFFPDNFKMTGKSLELPCHIKEITKYINWIWTNLFSWLSVFKHIQIRKQINIYYISRVF